MEKKSPKYQITENSPWLLFDQPDFFYRKGKGQMVAFVDASGNLDEQDRFFGVGILLVDDPGKLTDELYPIAQKAQNLSKNHQNKSVSELVNSGKYKEAIKVLKRAKRFEMKYERISPAKFEHYKEMIKIFLKNSGCRFSCVAIDKEKIKSAFSNWDGYANYAAAIIARELTKLKNSKISLVIDEMPKPKSKKYPLEQEILFKLEDIFKKEKYDVKKIGKIMSVIRIESHSNLLMQLTDVILGSVMYDLKKRENLIYSKRKLRKEEVIQELRNGLRLNSLAGTYTKHKPIYFDAREE